MYSLAPLLLFILHLPRARERPLPPPPLPQWRQEQLSLSLQVLPTSLPIHYLCVYIVAVRIRPSPIFGAFIALEATNHVFTVSFLPDALRSFVRVSLHPSRASELEGLRDALLSNLTSPFSTRQPAGAAR